MNCTSTWRWAKNLWCFTLGVAFFNITEFWPLTHEVIFFHKMVRKEGSKLIRPTHGQYWLRTWKCTLMLEKPINWAGVNFSFSFTIKVMSSSWDASTSKVKTEKKYFIFKINGFGAQRLHFHNNILFRSFIKLTLDFRCPKLLWPALYRFGNSSEKLANSYEKIAKKNQEKCKDSTSENRFSWIEKYPIGVRTTDL